MTLQKCKLRKKIGLPPDTGSPSFCQNNYDVSSLITLERFIYLDPNVLTDILCIQYCFCISILAIDF